MLLDHFVKQSTLFHMASCTSIWLQELGRYICQNIQSIAALKVDNVMCLEHTPSLEYGGKSKEQMPAKRKSGLSLNSGERERDKKEQSLHCCTLI